MASCSSSASRSANQPSPSIWSGALDGPVSAGPPFSATMQTGSPPQTSSSCPPSASNYSIPWSSCRTTGGSSFIIAHPTAEWVARQIVRAFPWEEAPRYLVRYRDAVYGEVVKRRLRGLGICDRPIAPHSPWQNAFVERLIGSVRRECLDHVVVFGASRLRRMMSAYASYYNQARTHLALEIDAPVSRSIERFGRIVGEPMVGGLHHRYARI